MKKVLVISYYWPPAGGSGVQRWLKFCKFLPTLGWEPVVYTPSNPADGPRDESLGNDIPEGIEVIRRPIVEPYSLYRKLLGVKSTSAPATISSGKLSFKKRISLFIRANLFIPDPRALWVRPSVAFLKEYLKEHPVEAIITTGPPHSIHLIGRNLMREMHLPMWIADFRDPWTRIFYNEALPMTVFSKIVNARLEKSVLDEASTIIAVSPAVRDDLSERTGTPVHLITNGYDAEDFQGPAPALKEGRFVIAQTGIIAADGNPVTLWKVLSDKCAADGAFAQALEIRICGSADPEVLSSIRERGLEKNLTVCGYLPHNETVAEQRGADLLLMPLRYGSEGDKIIPGKLFEYMASHRPVLAVGCPDGPSAEMLERHACGRMFAWDDAAGMEEFISQRWEAFKLGDRGFTGGDVSKYSREQLTHKLVRILDTI